MQDFPNKQTLETAQPEKRGRGRPVTGHAASAAERMRKYRANKKAARALMPEITPPVGVTKNEFGQSNLNERMAELDQQLALLSDYICKLEDRDSVIKSLRGENRQLKTEIDRLTDSLALANQQIGKLTFQLDKTFS